MIDRYLTEAITKIALGFVAALAQAYTQIGRQPAAGSPYCAHPLNPPGLRFWSLTLHPYLALYLEHAGVIDVWRVLHQQRDLPDWMVAA